MAKAKTRAKAKTKAPAKAKAKAATKAKAPAKARTRAAAKAKAPAKTKTKPKAGANAKPSAVEKEVAALLDDYDNGQVDNAWDVLPRMTELDKALPKSSSLRRDFDKMLAELEEICQSS